MESCFSSCNYRLSYCSRYLGVYDVVVFTMASLHLSVHDGVKFASHLQKFIDKLCPSKVKSCNKECNVCRSLSRKFIDKLCNKECNNLCRSLSGKFIDKVAKSLVWFTGDRTVEVSKWLNENSQVRQIVENRNSDCQRSIQQDLLGCKAVDEEKAYDSDLYAYSS
ncbi:hypothetical protein DFS34DRAFT_666022 [Phlyctochytrium arcticum]|nr:hypothetical protein DFS34DRAFT_666022 [Phlyctochytrium arcticum]